MRLPARPRDRALFDAVFSDPTRAAAVPFHRLTLAGEPVVAESLRSFSADDGAARAVEGALGGEVRPRHRGRRAHVDTFVEGRRFRSYVGWCLGGEYDSATPGRHSLAGSTSGYWQEGDDAVRFDAPTSYANFPPSMALWDMLRRLPYARIAIPDAGSPAFHRVGEDAFAPMAALGEGVGAVEELCGLRQRDTGWDWGRAHLRPSVAGAGSPVATWSLGEHLSGLSVERTSAGRHRSVAVVRQMPDGSWRDLVLPRPEVRYRPEERPPPFGTTFYEEVGAEGATLGAQAEADLSRAAQARAFVLVQSLGRGAFRCEATTHFLDPRVEDFDAVDLVRTDWNTGRYERYRMLVESHDEDYAANTATYRGTAALVEEVVPRPQRPPPVAVGAGIVVHFEPPVFVRPSPFFPSQVNGPGGLNLPGAPGVHAPPPGPGVVLAGDERTVEELGDYTIEEMS